MALFNKLFSSTRKKTCSRRQDDACDKLFAFTNDQVRLVLFRECDLWGRKLLFDSQTVQKIPLVGNGAQSNANDAADEAEKKSPRYDEISNGFGYLRSKPNNDVHQLGEMIFGSVAMSYRGTSYKIHSLSTPNRLMCTQIFQSPRHSGRGGRNSAPSRSHMHTCQVSSQSLEQSLRFDESSNSANSFSDHSVYSTTSDTLLVCRGNHSTPLDVPQAQIIIPSSNVVGDSGFCGGHSYSSTSSCPPRSVPINDTNRGVTFSCGSLYKRWLRSTSTSLEYSASSLTGSASADECYTKPHPRTSKLGLAIIIQFTNEYEERLEQFLMDHAALIEGMVWRARQGAETALIRQSHFLSLMSEVAVNTSQWLVNLLSGPKLSAHLWLTVSTDCDNSFSIINNNSSGSRIFGNDSSSVSSSSKSDLTNSYDSTNGLDKSSEFAFLRFLKSEWDSFGSGGGGGGGGKKIGPEKDFIAERFVRDFCELLETIDVKHTNFFISTLITAVLTHHLGWVATALKPSVSDNILSDLKTGNPLWGQLNDLYGAVGYPTKMAHTVIMGSNKAELVTKILNTLTYFIRCSHIERKTVVRVDKEKEDFEVNRICQENFCIPKENYKKYEDHLKEIAANNNNNYTSPPTKIGLNKTTSCSSNLNQLAGSKSNHEIMDRITSLGLQAIHTPPLKNERQFKFYLDVHEHLPTLENNRKTLTRIPRASALNCLDTSNHENEIVQRCPSENVVFVLGENEELVDLHKTVNGCLSKTSKPERPTTLHIPEKTTKKKSFCTAAAAAAATPNPSALFQDSDFVKYEGTYSLKPSTSWTQLHLRTTNKCKPETKFNSLSDGATCSTSGAEMRKEKLEFNRSHSVPPEGGNKSERGPEATPKYRYTGVKFNFQQHPQIFENYMRSKNIELSNLSFSEKTMKFNGTLSKDFDFSVGQNEPVIVETLQTPSNASELEFTSELMVEKQNMQQAKEVTAEIPAKSCFIRNALPNTIIKEPKYSVRKLRTVELPMPKSSYVVPSPLPVAYTRSLFRGIGEHYISDMVLQGTCLPKSRWETYLRKDLGLAVRHPMLDHPVEEAVAIIANTDTWEVQLMSSHTFVIDKGSTGVRVGMSQLVANMLESLLHMWKLHTPPEYCLMHIEQRLQEFCVRSKALAQLLLATDFCSMELLTSTLQLEVNDVPLLMAIASTHSPQVMQKYGLSFQ